jgi:hypothetical protein
LYKQCYFFKETGSGKHEVTQILVRGVFPFRICTKYVNLFEMGYQDTHNIIEPMSEKKGSGTLFWLCTFEKELPEWHSGVFCHKNTTVYKYIPISQSISHNYFLKNGPRSDAVSHKKGTTDENQVFISSYYTIMCLIHP